MNNSVYHLYLNRVSKILECNKVVSHTAIQISDDLDIPIATTYRMIGVLVSIGWLVEHKRVWGTKRRVTTYLSACSIVRLVR